MAVIKKDGTYSGVPMGFRRNNPIPLDHDSIWYSFEEAQTYAQTSPVAYVGQILVIVNESEATSNVYVITNTSGDLLKLNVDVDNQSIIYLDEELKGLSIKGYKEATQGYMLVKDETSGLAWIKPLDETELRNAVAASESAASQSNNYATQAGNSAIAADLSARQAERINQQTMNWVNEKFWWGSLEEYNALETVNEGTFYFVNL